jgi:Tol biopolymer transport system component
MMAGSPQRGAAVLWRYDLSSGVQTKLFESPWPALFVPNPAGNSALMITRKDRFAGPVDVSLLDLATGTETPVTTIERSETPLWPTIASIVWSADGDKIAFLARQDGGLLRPAVYLMKERRLVLPDDVQVHELLEWASLGWTTDGLKLVLADPAARSLRITGPDLDWKTTMAVPASMSPRFRAWPFGNAVLVSDHDNEAVWRLDLMTEKWKKIF